MAKLRSSKRVARILCVVLLTASAACTEASIVPAAPADTPSPSTSPEGLEAEPVQASPGPNIHLINPRTGKSSVLLGAPGTQTNAELSPDGTRVVFESWLGGTSQILVLETHGTTRQLTHGKHDAHDPTWSPDGTQIAFATTPRKRFDADIFVMDADGIRIRRLVGTRREDGHPDWSPDGSRIAFHTRYDDGFPGVGGLIWVASVRTRALTRLTRSHTRYAAVDPAWSPDGRSIAYSGFDRVSVGGPSAAVWLMRPDGTNKRRIGRKPIASGYNIENPSWSPNGSWIVFADRWGPIRAINVKTEQIRIVPGTRGNVQPSWSPRGILMSPSNAASAPVNAPRWKPLPLVDLARGTYFVNVRTGKAVRLPRRITSVPGAGNYDVSPDGTMIIFDNARLAADHTEPVERGLHQLYVANIDGSHLRQLSDDPVGASKGSWSPDGKSVVYLGGRARLMVLDVATGSTTRQLAAGRASNFQNPIFSEDGSAILLTRSDPPRKSYLPEQPQADLWTIPIAGGHPQLLLEDRGYASYAPDGATIAFPRIVYYSRGPAGGAYAEIWVSDTDGSDARRLVRQGWNAQDGWSPSGRWIFYSNLYVFDMTTGRSIFLSAGVGQDWVDKETLIVVRERGSG